MRELDGHAVEAAVAGGSVLAAGGGGWVNHGYLVGRTAIGYGAPRLATLDEIADDATIVTVSAIGAPAASDWEMRPGDYVRALRLLMEALDEPTRRPGTRARRSWGPSPRRTGPAPPATAGSSRPCWARW